MTLTGPGGSGKTRLAIQVARLEAPQHPHGAWWVDLGTLRDAALVPDSVLRKTGPLTVPEYDLMKAHTSMGHRILAATSTPMFQMAAEIAQSHHEWWDGGGYPHGLARGTIPLSARIMAIAPWMVSRSVSQIGTRLIATSPSSG
mgnify:CR=1 FL=1